MQRAQPWISIKSIPVKRALRRAAHKQAWYVYLGMYRYHVVMDYSYTLTLLGWCSIQIKVYTLDNKY